MELLNELGCHPENKLMPQDISKGLKTEKLPAIEYSGTTSCRAAAGALRAVAPDLTLFKTSALIGHAGDLIR